MRASYSLAIVLIAVGCATAALAQSSSTPISSQVTKVVLDAPVTAVLYPRLGTCAVQFSGNISVGANDQAVVSIFPAQGASATASGAARLGACAGTWQGCLDLLGALAASRAHPKCPGLKSGTACTHPTPRCALHA